MNFSQDFSYHRAHMEQFVGLSLDCYFLLTTWHRRVCEVTLDGANKSSRREKIFQVPNDVSTGNATGFFGQFAPDSHPSCASI